MIDGKPDNIILLEQSTCVLRVNVHPDGGVKVATDHNALHDMDERDIIFLIGCVRQLEHRLLTTYNERFKDQGE